jgi:hypothetical protein
MMMGPKKIDCLHFVLSQSLDDNDVTKILTSNNLRKPFHNLKDS